ncbi:MAG TPA: hypothetical protein VHD61_10060 [Lacunisphaera sp.]|nr:hypothetical protein [Lacunisphaera sp.]
MNNFARFFLNEDWKKSPSAARVHVGAFGKHPGWNDHLDDIGLVTASLVEARSILYGGIARQIEHAAWEKAGPEKVMPGFDHVFHWRRLNESHTGLIWSSQDGKGRALYPMILIAHCVTRSFSWLANDLLPALEELKTKCRSTTSSGVVISYIKAAEQALQARFPSGPHVSTGPGHGVAAWAAHFTREQEAFRRVVHHLRRNFSVFMPGTFAWCQDGKPAGTRCLRLPQIPGAPPAESLNAWISFLATQLDPAAPFFGLAPAGREWMDVIVGEPDPADFFLLRALPAALPVVTDIPYQLEAVSQTNDESLLASLAAGRLPEISCLNGQSVETNREAAAKWLVRFRPGSRPGFFSRLFG